MNVTVFMSLFLIAVSLQSTPGSGIYLETRPSSEIDESTKALELSCQVETKPNLQTTLVIIINKDKRENKIAEVREGHSPWASSRRYKVEGSVDNESSNRFLNVTVTSPGHIDTGAYTCLVLSLREDGQIEEKSDSKNIKWNDGLESKFIILERKLNDLLKKNEDQITAIKDLETSNKQQKSKITDLETADMQQKSQMLDFTKANEQQVSKITSLENAEEQHKSKIKALEAADKQQKSKIKSLESSDEKQKSQISALNKANEHQQSKIRALETVENQQKSQISALTKANELQKTEIIDLAKMNEQRKMKEKQQALQIESLKADYENQTLQISALFAEDEQQKSEILDLVKFTNLTSLKLQKFQNSPVAFRAFKGTALRFTGTIRSWSTTAYHYFQQGGAFNPTTGVFTAPSDGLYAFNSFVRIVGSNRVVVYIRHNGGVVGWVFAWDDDDRDTSSHSIVLDMKKHDTADLCVRVWKEYNRDVDFFFNGYRVTKS